MGWNVLTFLAEPAFVIPWYVFGSIGAALVIADVRMTSTRIKPAMRLAWPIIVFFFSLPGLLLYAELGRRPGSDQAQGVSFRKLNAAVIHCVAGDGIGIVSAMVIARALGMTFWGEFWFEYATGFLVGWLVFQRKSIEHMAPSKGAALAMAFRAEFFSMMAVMGGMGAVMTFVTPAVVGAQPVPLTFAFWGFALAGLLVGYVFGLPMNWLMLKVGWKGETNGAHAEHRLALVALMGALGAVALALPEWLHEVREGSPVVSAVRAPGTPMDEPRGPDTAALELLERGLNESLRTASQALGAGRRSEATNALDAAQRAAEVAAKNSPGQSSVLDSIRQARRALQMADSARASRKVREGLADLERTASRASTRPRDGVEHYAGVPVLDARGVVIGEVDGARPGGKLELALGGVRDAWGVLDLSASETVTVPESRLLFGPHRALGKSYVMLPVDD